MEDTIIRKVEHDYTDTVNQAIPKALSICDTGSLDAALDILMALEKQTRLDSDAISTGKLLEAMIGILGDKKEWARLNEHLVLMTKKRSQLKQAVTKMVQKAITYVNATPDEPKKLALIETLRTVTEGKIYVELERARLTKQLAEIYEKNGQIDQAATILQELQVETFGSMEKSEKVEFILEQMRLCLAKKDYVRTQILSGKVSTKFFDGEGTDPLKIKFYHLKIEIDSHSSNYLEISKHYWELYNTKSISESADQAKNMLKNAVACLLLAPFENEQNDLMHRRLTVRGLEELVPYLDLLKAFTRQEILSWVEFCQKYEKLLKAEVEIFQMQPVEEKWKDFKSRLIEHNIRVVAAYYTRIRLNRMAQLLDLDAVQAEDYLSKLVINKTVCAKIDRLESVVHFTEKKSPTDVLNDWSDNINTLMSLINKTTHLINKERMLHCA